MEAGLLIGLTIVIGFLCLSLASKGRNPLIVLAGSTLCLLLLSQAYDQVLAELLPTKATATIKVLLPTIEPAPTIESIVEPLIVIVTATPNFDHTKVATQHYSDWSKVWPNVARWKNQIEDVSQAYGVDALLIASVIQQESKGNPLVCSYAGACGLMQLMPATAAELGVNDPFDAAQNLSGGTRYLRQQLIRYDNDLSLALAAYNAGPGTVDRYGGVPPIPETKTYVANITKYYKQLHQKKGLIWPTSGRRISQQPSASHMALDIAVSLGTPIIASASGTVYIMPYDADGYGKHVIVDHGNGLRTLYAHLSSYSIQNGESVTLGQIIGRSGSTGRSTGPHLHYEVRNNGVLENPYNYLP